MKVNNKNIILYVIFFLAIILFIMFALLTLSIKRCAVNPDNRTPEQIEDSVMKHWLSKNWKIALRDSKMLKNKYFYTAIKFDSLLLSHNHHDYLKSIDDFIYENPTWPRVQLLISKAERYLNNYNFKVVLHWCNKYPPKTYMGMLAKLDALVKLYSKKNSNVIELIKTIWINCNECSIESKFFSQFSNYLTKEDHIEKINHLLLNNSFDNLSSIVQLLNDDQYKRIVDCRVNLKTRSHGAIQCYQNLINQGVQDYGLMFDFLFHSRKITDNKKHLHDCALLLLRLPVKENYKKKIINLRLCYSRELLLRNDFLTAYNLLTKGIDIDPSYIDYIKINHLAGFISLAYLNDAKLAKKHFLKVNSCSTYPSDISKNCYFLYLCYKNSHSVRDQLLSRQYLNKGAEYPITFYGQVCMLVLGKNNIDLNMRVNEKLCVPNAKIYTNNTDYFEDKIYFLKTLIRHNKYVLSEIILTDLFKNITKRQIEKVIDEIIPITSGKNCQMMLVNTALNRNVVYIKYLFPEYKLEEHKTYCDASLLKGIVRKESVFQNDALSKKSAIGLMQITNDTFNFCFRKGRLVHSQFGNISDIKTNIAVGSYYINFLQKEIYNGNLLMAIAAYNCGREHIRRWNLIYGPLNSKNDIFRSIRWIETIPFFAVQEYVKSVVRNKNIYFALNNNGKLCIMNDFNLTTT